MSIFSKVNMNECISQTVIAIPDDSTGFLPLISSIRPPGLSVRPKSYDLSPLGVCSLCPVLSHQPAGWTSGELAFTQKSWQSE